MAKKNSNGFQTSIPQGQIHVRPIEEVMPGSMLPYAEFVILDRALPRDRKSTRLNSSHIH